MLVEVPRWPIEGHDFLRPVSQRERVAYYDFEKDSWQFRTKIPCID